MTKRQFRLKSRLISVKNQLTILVIFGLLLFTRLFQLNRFPIAFNPDEMIYLVEAKAIAATGEPLTAGWEPLKLQSLGEMWAEWPALTLVPGFMIVEDVLLASRLVPALLGITLPFLLGWLVWGLSKDRLAMICTVVISGLNPWLWQFSRMSFDPLLSIWFYVIGLAILLNLVSWKKMISLLFFLCGFFQYQGLKPILLPIVGLFSLYNLHQELGCTPNRCQLKATINNLKRKIQTKNRSVLALLVVNLAVLILFGAYMFILLPRQQAAGRVQNLIWNDASYQQGISELVDTERRLALNSPFVVLFSNKLTVNLHQIMQTYAQVFDLERLFVVGDAERSLFSVFSYGVFHPFDLVLFLVGLVVLLGQKKWRALGALLMGGIIVAPFSAIVTTSGEWMIFRPSFVYVLMVLVMAFGLRSLIRKNKLMLWLTVSIYFLTVLNFAYIFFYRYPLISADGLRFKERVLASYIGRVDLARPVVVYHPEPKQFLLYYYLFANRCSKADLNNLRKQLATSDSLFEYKNLTVTSGCIDTKLWSLDKSTVIVDRTIDECEKSEKELEKKEDSVKTTDDWKLDRSEANSIVSIIDSGTQYSIFGDVVCPRSQLSSFLHLKDLRLTTVEAFDDISFCENWITDLTTT